jgi:hypothetical protein
MREHETTKEIERLLNRIRETRITKGASDQISKDMDTLLEVVDVAVTALNARYRHYGPSGELRVEADEWVKAEDVLRAMNEALQVGVVRDIFAGSKFDEEG